jgi:class 3 adenylate cyclase
LQELADSALAAFLKALVDMDNANTNGTLSMYLVHNRVVKRFGTNFRIKMGFGMHVGWAIEGAIGSSYKIDATYMSPHVEMSDRLEAGSKIFGVPINISHWLYALLSPKARKFLRPIDRILVEGCPTPMTVYTYVWVGSERSTRERSSMRAKRATKGGSRWCAARRKEVTAREKEEGRWAALALFCAR